MTHETMISLANILNGHRARLTEGELTVNGFTSAIPFSALLRDIRVLCRVQCSTFDDVEFTDIV